MTAGIAAPAGDSASRLRLKRLVGPKAPFRRVRRPYKYEWSQNHDEQAKDSKSE